MRRAIFFGLGLMTALAVPARAQTPVALLGKKPVNCVAIVNAAALKAVTGTSAFGQMSVYGDPVVMGPNHLRVDVKAFNAIYAADVIIDRNCNVLSVSTDLETNPSPG